MFQFRRIDVAGTNSPDFTGLFQFFERRYSLFDWRRRVLPMGDVEVDIIGTKATQAFLDLMDDRIPPQIAMDWLSILIEEVLTFLGMPDEAAFGSNYGLVAASGNCFAYNFLRASGP